MLNWYFSAAFSGYKNGAKACGFSSRLNESCTGFSAGSLNEYLLNSDTLRIKKIRTAAWKYL